MARLAEAISRKIRDEIVAGTYGPGDRIPSERELERMFRVSRVTVNRALTQLHACGLVERHRGSGTFVASTQPAEPPTRVARKLAVYITAGGRKRGDIYVSTGQEGMCNELNKNGQDLVTRFCYSEEEYLAELRSLSDSAFEAAFIWHRASQEGDRVLAQLKEQGVRFVLLDSFSSEVACDYVVTDNANGAQQMVRHLVSQGHRDIVYLTPRVTGLSSLESRQVGFVQEMLAHGLPLTHESIWSFDESSDGALERAVDSILACPRRPTAIFVANDLHAFDVYDFLKKRGLNVPTDISLAGFDDIDRSRHFEVPLTTVAQNFYEMGCTAASIILRQPQEGDRLFYQINIKPSLIVRESVSRLA